MKTGELVFQTAIETHAQLVRFVQRKQMTSEEAAKFSIRHALRLAAFFEQATDEHNPGSSNWLDKLTRDSR